MTIEWPVASPEASKRALQKNARIRSRPKTTTREDTDAWRKSATDALTGRQPSFIDRILEGLPLTGDIDGRVAVPVPQVDDAKFGQSSGIPFVLEIDVDRVNKAPANVGHKVDDVFFQNYPPLLFNVCFACGAPEGPTRVGLYGDPRSRWFNVFLGYYQLDVLANAASSPFGYDTNGDVVKDQVLRISLTRSYRSPPLGALTRLLASDVNVTKRPPLARSGTVDRPFCHSPLAEVDAGCTVPVRVFRTKIPVSVAEEPV